MTNSQALTLRDVLWNASTKLNRANRDAVQGVLLSADQNADQTVYQENAASIDDWGHIFLGSIGTLLAYGEQSKVVTRFFTARGVRY